MAHGGEPSLEDFKAYVGTDEDSDFVSECLQAGKQLVNNYIGEVETVPHYVHIQAILIASSELFHRRSAPNGVAQFASFDGAPIRVAKDPLNAVYPLLQRFVGYAV
jgi:hypothetical protein